MTMALGPKYFITAVSDLKFEALLRNAPLQQDWFECGFGTVELGTMKALKGLDIGFSGTLASLSSLSPIGSKSFNVSLS